MTWRLARSLIVLRDQINALSPNRSKISDGTIGNAEHASRSSDHNPWLKDGKVGVVTALDLTNDPDHGIASDALARTLVAGQDKRLKYVISNGRIASAEKGWVWRKYTGKNSHSHHVHVSVKPKKALYDDTAPWQIVLGVSPDVASQPPVEPRNPVLALGTKGHAVERLQRLLGITADADFGPKTLAAVKAFQRRNKLVADGIVGPATWEALVA